ncbi:hypothetical protein L4174_020775 [Photobacterium sp. CCB-ST2H9]|uniref:hypothetical protein n=1 Tax=unclassified Photobacterium TaxID=2628852 RepID=UPI002006C84C|nr:hypothetical protein [Photobacterium sp. CCB-ST2H9]UTM59147.1 hypothetical protein L4174_020775 [Photobacterium sp. CCB-ST2H9]
MKHIVDFIEQLEREEHSFTIWVYARNGKFSPFAELGKTSATKLLQKAIDQNLQVVVELHTPADHPAYLILTEVHIVVPVLFHQGQVRSLNKPLAA